MKAIDVIRHAMQVSDKATLQLIEDMRDSAVTQPTPKRLAALIVFFTNTSTMAA